MNSEQVYNLLFTSTFVENWKKVLSKVFQYNLHSNFVIVPNILGVKVFSYLPLLNYTDLSVESTKPLLDELGDKNYQIRAIHPSYTEFKANDTVVMRMPLLGQNSEEVWLKTIPQNMRKQLKKSFRNDFLIQKGNETKLIEDFYQLFSGTMKKFGTPVFGIKLFYQIPEFMDSKYYVVYFEGKPIAGMLLLTDEKIVWCPYSGTNEAYIDLRPGHFMFWEGIKDACDQSKMIFDFGRSAYGNNNYFFKERWGAIPVKVDIIKPKADNIYSKYSLASKIYKNLPNFITNKIGPYLCRKLPDL
jgi:hypothetical protein